MALRRGASSGPKSGRRSSMLMMRGSRCTDGSIIAWPRLSAYPSAPATPFSPSHSLSFYGKIYHLRVACSICFIEIISRAQSLLRPTAARTGFYRDGFRRFIFDDRLNSGVSEGLINANRFRSVIYNSYVIYLFLPTKDLPKSLVCNVLQI